MFTCYNARVVYFPSLCPLASFPFFPSTTIFVLRCAHHPRPWMLGPEDQRLKHTKLLSHTRFISLCLHCARRPCPPSSIVDPRSVGPGIKPQKAPPPPFLSHHLIVFA